MSAKEPLPEYDAKWIKEYGAEVSKAFAVEFGSAGDRFKSPARLLERFTGAINEILEKGRTAFPAVDAAHNELCIASALLSDKDFACLDYEPALTGCAKSIDFRATTGDGRTVFVDVKTIQPELVDRWDQYKELQQLFPPNVNVVIAKEWLGGELWHNSYAARSRMLEYTLALEEKIRDGKLATDKTFSVLALCGAGFHWSLDELEDFVSFYQNGSHRPDDAFSKMEEHYIKKKGITIAKTISRFACMNRPHFDIRHRRLNWNVQPPGPAKF